MALDQIADNGCARQAMEEDDLLHRERAVEDRLIDVLGPSRISLVAELRMKLQVAPSSSEAGWRMEPRLGPAFGPLFQEEMANVVG